MCGQFASFWDCAWAQLHVKESGGGAVGHTMETNLGCGIFIMAAVGSITSGRILVLVGMWQHCLMCIPITAIAAGECWRCVFDDCEIVHVGHDNVDWVGWGGLCGVMCGIGLLNGA